MNLPDQILGFDSWSLDTTTNDAWASDVDPPGKQQQQSGNIYIMTESYQGKRKDYEEAKTIKTTYLDSSFHHYHCFYIRNILHLYSEHKNKQFVQIQWCENNWLVGCGRIFANFFGGQRCIVYMHLSSLQVKSLWWVQEQFLTKDVRQHASAKLCQW